MTLEGTLPEAMDTQSKPNTVDARLPEALNTGPNAVAMVTSLRDAAAMGAKEMSVDESHHSEALGPLQEPAPTELPVTKGLNESRNELLQRVQALKKDLENWRGKLDTQVKSYREELGDLRSALNSEVEQLRVEFQDLRNTLKQQRELTATKLAKLDEPADAMMNSKQPLSTTEETN
ncbi:uncharacterized protein [Physcomitrium patens]|nr:uncharacterized protein LOC112295358 isoform X2 [Physcomitrium patens]|eukprot:XP_024402611.1 uncharacterized protein LOC112295358 isoform X2 [Physcomitrella patens]